MVRTLRLIGDLATSRTANGDRDVPRQGVPMCSAKEATSAGSRAQ